MANQALARTWAKRIEAGNKLFNNWEKEFKIPELYEYYKGRQWEGDEGYVINLFYSTIETKMPTLLFSNPQSVLKPKPKQLLVDPESAFVAAQNLQDSLNDWTGETTNYFNDNLEAAIFDCFFWFGIIETGYSADWIDNPKARKPTTNDESEDPTKSKKRKKFPSKLPIDERAYARYIPANTFRVAPGSARELTELDWCAYYEFFHKEDLKTFTNFEPYDYSGALDYTTTQSISSGISKNDQKFLRDNPDYVLVWKICDNRNHKRIVFIPGYNHIALNVEWRRFPFEDIRFRKPRMGFYPIPVTYNWLSPQNELNEVREQARTHRRRYQRKYLYRKSSGLDDTTMASLVHGEDGSFAEVNMDPAGCVAALPNADLGSSHFSAEVTSKDDFNVISGVTADQRAQNDRQTATSATIQDQRAQVRESREKIIVTNFVARVFKSVAMIFKQEFVNPMVVTSQEPDIPETGSYATSGPSVREVDPVQDFGGKDFDFDVEIEITSMSPVANEDEKRKMIEFMALMAQYPQFSLDPILVRELAFRIGYRNEKAIKRFMDMAQLQMIGMIEAGQQALAGQPGQAQGSNQTPNSPQQIQNQIAGQVG